MSWRTLITIAALLVVSSASGCKTYRLGACSLYRPDIQTVHVPIITSSTFRRGLGEQLTEAVVKQVELTTPYKVVGPDDADSLLLIRLDNVTKQTLLENGLSEARNIEFRYMITMTWTNRQGNLLTRSAMPLDETLVGISSSTSFLPESGMSSATAQQRVVNQLAREIVGQMEAGW